MPSLFDSETDVPEERKVLKMCIRDRHIESVDVFLSLSADDEANIMSALLAKRLGAKKAMVLIQRMAYINLIQGGTIDDANENKLKVYNVHFDNNQELVADGEMCIRDRGYSGLPTAFVPC